MIIIPFALSGFAMIVLYMLESFIGLNGLLQPG